MSFCHKCGKNIAYSAAYCDNCRKEFFDDLKRRQELPVGGTSLTDEDEKKMQFIPRGRIITDLNGGRREKKPIPEDS